MDVKLVMFKPNGQRKDFDVKDGVTVVGRGESCDLRIPLLSVSRNHTQLTLTDGKLTAEDMGSSNGTYVNSQRITESPVSAGDRLAIGPVIFIVQIDGEPAEIKPLKLDESAQFDLDADVFADDPQGDSADDLDPISALEALAGETDDDADADEDALL